jgi:hypothetical protein
MRTARVTNHAGSDPFTGHELADESPILEQRGWLVRLWLKIVSILCEMGLKQAGDLLLRVGLPHEHVYQLGCGNEYVLLRTRSFLVHVDIEAISV